MNHEYVGVKIVLVGEPATGKSTLRKSFVSSELKESLLMTLGVDIAKLQIPINDNLTLNAQIWDIAGQESWGFVTKQFLQGAQAAIVVFDLTRPDTFDKCEDWIKKVLAENPAKKNNIPYIIIGNKADLTDFIKVEDDTIEYYVEFLNRHRAYSQTDVEYVKTSAKTGFGVKQSLNRIGKILVEHFRQVEEEIGGSKFKTLLSEAEQEQETQTKEFVRVEDGVIYPDDKKKYTSHI